jgi:N-acetylmuramoyl-L-alanine amidase
MMLAAVLLASPPAKARPVVVMLDPGHGGTNLGARGPEINRYEKALTLAIARQTADELRKRLPGARVMLTRTRDRYLTLSQRVRLANRVRATLFVSIHLNASDSRTQHGFETYFLNREASDHEAERLASRENMEPSRSHTVRAAGGGAGDADLVLGAILSDLRQTAAHTASAALAKRVQKELARALGEAENRGVRQAAFDVLKGLRMPGVLVEVGFIDHPVEGPLMNTAGVQRRVARALAAAIAGHLEPAASR